MLRDVAGLNQVLYGTDLPYLRRDLAVNSKQRILKNGDIVLVEAAAGGVDLAVHASPRQ
jgi:hypothetical protein